jgi:Outer membrane protein beta-barrel domain
MKKNLLCSIFSCLLIANSLLAQSEQHFRAGIAAGINLSQMEGDGQEGYHKIGVSIGAKGAYAIKPNFDISAELLYNSRGSRPKPSSGNETYDYRDLRLTAELNYADILLAANFHFLPNANATFYRQSLQLGVAYGRLLSSNITTTRSIFNDLALQNDLLNGIKRDDIGLVVGYSWFATPRLGICAKHTVSLLKIYQNPKEKTSNVDYNSFIPYNLSLQLVFNFIAPKLNIKGQIEKARKAKERKKKNALEEL